MGKHSSLLFPRLCNLDALSEPHKIGIPNAFNGFIATAAFQACSDAADEPTKRTHDHHNMTPIPYSLNRTYMR